MPNFAFVAINFAGAKQHGDREAPSKSALTEALEREGLFVLEVAERTSGTARAAFSGLNNSNNLLDATRALAALLPAGLPLARSLDAAARLSAGAIAIALADVRTRVERGDSVAAALSAHSNLFPPHYIGLVRAGERAGDLGTAFSRLADQLEREATLRNRLLAAALYPIILTVAGGGAVLVLLLVVLPNFAELFKGSGAQLPRTTQFVLAASTALRRFWYLIPIALAAIAAIITSARSSSSGRLALAQFIDNLPLIRGLRRDAIAARFARLTGTLLSSGAPLLSALDDTIASVGDALAESALIRVRSAVREGASLTAAITAEPIFPPLLAQLTAVGEESSRLPDFLLKAAQLFEERSDRNTQRLVALAEPAMIVIFGVVIGFIALSVLQAIYSVNAGSFR
jgi:type II secretory pathway component PulF